MIILQFYTIKWCSTFACSVLLSQHPLPFFSRPLNFHCVFDSSCQAFVSLVHHVNMLCLWYDNFVSFYSLLERGSISLAMPRHSFDYFCFHVFDMKICTRFVLFPWDPFRSDNLHHVCVCIWFSVFFLCVSEGCLCFCTNIFLIFVAHFIHYFSWYDWQKMFCSVVVAGARRRCRLVCCFCWIISKNSLIRAFYSIYDFSKHVYCSDRRRRSCFSRIHRFYYFIILAIERLARLQRH